MEWADIGQSPGETPADVIRAVETLRRECGPMVVAIIFFGSRLVGTSPGVHSAADLLLVVEKYLPFYTGLLKAYPMHHGPRMLAATNRVLPPNIVSIVTPGSKGPGCKAVIITETDLSRALSARARDHFCMGRLTQMVRIVDVRDDQARLRIEQLLDRARRLAIDWVPLYHDGPFTVREFGRTMLETSYRAEIRPETGDRAGEVFGHQEAYLSSVFGPLLDAAVGEGKLTRVGDRYARARRAGLAERLRWSLYFHRSKTRATLRWSKYMLTYDDWIDYIVRKMERRAGIRIEVTKAERRWPLLLLWPKAIRVLRELSARRAAGAARAKDGDG